MTSTPPPPDGGLMGVLTELGFERATYPGLVRGLLDAPAGAPALRSPDTLITYGSLVGRIGAAAADLAAHGVAPGDQVAVMMRNRPETVVVHLAIQTLGATAALVNTSLSGDVLRRMLELAGAGLVIRDPDLAVPGGSVPWTSLVLDGDADPVPYLDALTSTPLDLAFVNYTSGTTGDPKGVVLPQLFSAVALYLARRLDMRPGDERIYLCTPLYHALGLAYAAMGLRLGAELVIAPSFSASGYWDDVRRYDCTFAYHVGTIARMLWNQPPRPDDGTHPLRVFMGGGMPPDIWEAFASRFNVRIIEGYAASDSVGTICNWGDAPAGSIGRPDPGVEVRVADTDDNDVAVGETGELLLRPAFSFGGPPVRYYNDDEATAEKNRGGWIRTGDLVRQDGDGNLFFVDRRKDVIRRRGVNLAPAEIERIVCGHPLIGECAALAVPSELGEDEIKLVVPRTDGLTVDEVVSFCSSALPGLMQPRYVELVDELPKTVTERVERYKLKQSWRTPATWDVAAGGYVTP